MVEGGDQRRGSEGSWQICNTMISLQRAEFLARQKLGFGAAREYRIQLSSAALAQPVDLSRLRTIVDNDRFADHGDFHWPQTLSTPPNMRIPFSPDPQ
jgi:hypothetical protein